jgi:acyl dehydratase
MQLISEITITKKDAQSYALLSGDINPIHLSHRIAKIMGLKGSIMHGFGLFAIIFEKLKAAGIHFSEIDVRFLQPVYLEEEILIYIDYSSENKKTLRVLNKEKSLLHLTGYIK